MDTSGLIQTYDSRISPSTPQSRATMATQYNPEAQYDIAPSTNMRSGQMIQQTVFSYGPYSNANINILVPAPQFVNNYVRARPLVQNPPTDYIGNRDMAYRRQSYIEEIESPSPQVKVEPLWQQPATSPALLPRRNVISSNSSSTSSTSSNSKTAKTASLTEGGNTVDFGTEVDTLMKAIQAKAAAAQNTSSPSSKQKSLVMDNSIKLTHETLQVTSGRSTDDKRYKYSCPIEDCGKKFQQKTHLDIHERAHTGVKPYECKLPGCDRTFSQLGNLKTHERRHTGERPYQCTLCFKRFAQRGNLRAHHKVHEQAKPYLCRLDNCGKFFTQLGNLKSHQNKFHAPTIRDLTSKFASFKDGDVVNAADKELWEYFADLYKNSNKGIKGRGKDRKVGTFAPGMRHMNMISSTRPGYSMAGPGRGNIGPEFTNSDFGIKPEPSYEMLDEEMSEHSGSSMSSSFDDSPTDGFEDQRRDLAFGDRIY